MNWSTLISIIVIIFILAWVWTHRAEIKLSWQMPGVVDIPFIGSAWRFLFQENLEAIDTILRPFNNIEKPIGIWIGTKFLIFIDNVRDIEKLLFHQNAGRDDRYLYIKDTSGVDGLFTLEGEKWGKHRRLVSPSFNEKVVLSYVPTFYRNSLQLIESLKEMVNKEPFDIRRFITDFTLEAFLEATFSTNIEPLDKVLFQRYMKIGQSVVGKRMFLPWYQSDLIWKWSGYLKLSEEVARISHEISMKIIEKTMKDESSELPFLKRLLRVSEENNDFSTEDVKAEAVTALTAGADSSSWAIAFTILLLAMHPEHQDRVFEELKSILPSKDTPIRPEYIEKMIYLEMCIKESLRLFPVVPMISRKVKGGPININDYEIQPGMTIVIAINRVHRNMKYWGQNANEFDPRRFSSDNLKHLERFAFMPFSNGPRICVGIKYANVLMKSILAGVFRNYRVTTPLKLADLRVKMKVNICLLNKHMVQIYERNE